MASTPKVSYSIDVPADQWNTGTGQHIAKRECRDGLDVRAAELGKSVKFVEWSTFDDGDTVILTGTATVGPKSFRPGID